jgi:CDP-diacylglycerol--glycerol-3-phosphate 3-phosphatidyltransferase
MSLANKITLARAALIPPALFLLRTERYEAACAVFLLAAAGDVLDGMVARQRGEVTAWGKVLDPVVDKALYLSLLALLTILGKVPLSALLLFAVPHLGLGAGALFLHLRKHKVQGARALGKIAAALTFVAMVFLLMRFPYGLTLLYLAIGVTYLAALDYLRTALRA